MTKMSKALTDVVSISGDSKDIKSLLKIMKFVKYKLNKKAVLNKKTPYQTACLVG